MIALEIKEKDIVSEIQKKLDSVDDLAYHMQNYLNIAYYAGKQWIAYDQTNKRLFEPPKEPHKVRLVANRIQPIVRTELAKLTKNKPIMGVIPASNEDDDIKSAKIAGKVCEWLEYELDLQTKDRENGLWGLTCGMGFIKPFWNIGKGDMIQDPDDGTQLKLGDVDVDVVSTFELKWDPSAKKWSEVKWICHEKPRDVDYVKEVYGVEVEPEKGILNTNLYEGQLRNLNSNWTTTSYKPMENAVMVKEYWEKPTKKYPKGRRVTIANDKVLLHEEDIGFGPEDNTERELPFFPFIHIKIPGRVHGQAIIENLIPIQREYNKSRSQIIENKNLMANPIWLAEEGAFVEDPTDMPGSIVEYHKGFNKPEMTQPTSIGADVYKNIEQCIEEFFFISGQQEVSHGSTPPGVKSGVAISFLQEQDDTKMGPSIANFIECKQNYMSYMLKMIRYKYDIPRTIKVVGQNKEVEVIEFMGSQLTSTDVRIQEGSMFQQSRAAKQEWIFNLIGSGVLNPVQDKQIILKMLELGTVDELYDEENLDINQAQKEQQRWEKGDPSPIVRDFFNHTIHIMEHNKFRKTEAYEELHPELQMVIDQHVEEHLSYLIPQEPIEPNMDPTQTPM